VEVVDQEGERGGVDPTRLRATSASLRIWTVAMRATSRAINQTLMRHPMCGDGVKRSWCYDGMTCAIRKLES